MEANEKDCSCKEFAEKVVFREYKKLMKELLRLYKR